MKKSIALSTLCLLIIILTTACGREGTFNGSRTSNNDQFIMDYSIFTGTKTHEMQLEEGAVIDVDIENTAGKLTVSIEDEKGEHLYKGDYSVTGDKPATGEFSVETSNSGKYKFYVTGEKAKGGVSFKVVKDIDNSK